MGLTFNSSWLLTLNVLTFCCGCLSITNHKLPITNYANSVSSTNAAKPIHAQFWLGKIPCSAMTKFSTRYGDMFSCGWLPPVARIHCGLMAVLAVGLKGLLGSVGHIFKAGEGSVAVLLLPIGTWV